MNVPTFILIAAAQADVGRLMAGFFLATLLGVAAIFLLKRRGADLFRNRKDIGPQLAVDSRLALGGRQFILVVSWNGHRHLLGVSPGTIQHLAVLETPETAFTELTSPEQTTHGA